MGKDFEKPSVGGWDYIYADAADFVYFAGHGDDTPAFYFGVNEDGDGNYPYMLHYSEAEWGDEDLEWIFLSACECLAESSYYKWKSAFKGLHGITGFDTEVVDSESLGEIFATYLTGEASIGYAWQVATKEDPAQDSYYWPVWAAIYRVVVYARGGWLVHDYYYDYLPGYGSGIHTDPTFYQ